MNLTLAGSNITELNTLTPDNWDDQVARAGGHLLQSWRWGQFKSMHGWQPDHLSMDNGSALAMAQILYRAKGPVSVGYVPRGPVVSGAASAQLQQLVLACDTNAAHRNALWTAFEPDQVIDWPESVGGFFPGGPHIQPGRTVKVPLLEDEALLNQMHSKSRYSVRLALRKGVEVERVPGTDAENVADFYKLLADTSKRNQFGIHSPQYYADFMSLFGVDALMLFARVDGERVASIVAAKFGDEAIYMYGASSTALRAHGATYLLQFEAMRWAREAGMKRYDLWGIPMQESSSASENEQETESAPRGGAGLQRFKLGFGGEVVDYPPTLERLHRPMLAKMAKRYLRNQA